MSAPNLIMDQLPTVPSWRMCGSASMSTIIFASLVYCGVTPEVVLPESHSVQALRPPTSVHVARHSLSSGLTIGLSLVFPEDQIQNFQLSLSACPSGFGPTIDAANVSGLSGLLSLIAII